jgi:hypothetical protein
VVEWRGASAEHGSRKAKSMRRGASRNDDLARAQATWPTPRSSSATLARSTTGARPGVCEWPRCETTPRQKPSLVTNSHTRRAGSRDKTKHVTTGSSDRTARVWLLV